MSETKPMVEKRNWEEFREAQLLWWINRILHTFGWAIVVQLSDDAIVEVYPARVRFRGFQEEYETAGFIGLTKHLRSTIEDLERETAE